MSLNVRSIDRKEHIKNKHGKFSKAVYIHNMDGFEFERVVGEIFRLHGFSVVDIKPTGDAGRDLIIKKNGKRTLVECKHQKGTIGRPVIQKLHSAVEHDKRADHGIVVTTGKFSKQAEKYAKDVQIELIDLPNLRKLGSQVNMMILSKGEKLNKVFYPVNKKDITLTKLISNFKDKLISYPNPLEELFIPNKWSINLVPVYRVEYKIDHTTKTSVGIILSIREKGIIHVRADNLTDYDENVDKYLLSLKPVDFPIQIRLKKAKMPIFLYDESRIYSEAKKYLISRYSRIVTYYGKNNVKYTKTCIPNKKDITIYGMTQIYLPIQITPLKALNTKYYFKIIENKKFNPLILKKSEMDKCLICYDKIEEKGMICNSCGIIIHKQKWWRRSSHSYICDNCGKIICRKCGFWRRKWIVMKHVVCEECAQKEEEAGKNLEKVTPLSTDQSRSIEGEAYATGIDIESEELEDTTKYDPILDEFMGLESKLVMVEIEGKEAKYLRTQLNKRIKAKGLKVKTSVVNGVLYLAKL